MSDDDIQFTGQHGHQPNDDRSPDPSRNDSSAANSAPAGHRGPSKEEAIEPIILDDDELGAAPPPAEIIEPENLAAQPSRDAKDLNPFQSTWSRERKTDIVAIAKSRFGVWFVAWPVILLLMATIMIPPLFVVHEPSTTISSAEASALELQGRYVVGSANLPQVSNDQRSELLDTTATMNTGPWEGRMCFVVLAGELGDAEVALDELRAIEEAADDAGFDPNQDQRRIHTILTRLYGDYRQEEWKAPSLNEDDRQFLETQLGWYGLLALTPEDGPEDERRDSMIGSARFTAILLALAFLAAFVIGGCGLATAIGFGVQIGRGKVVSHVERRTINSNVYVETFAIWFVLFLVLSIAAGFVLSDEPTLVQNLLASAGVQLGSLAALTWPLIRKISRNDFCHQIGLTFDKPLREVFWGGVCYLATIPLMVGGFIVMLTMMGIAGMTTEVAEFESATSGPAHPIGEWIGQASILEVLLILFLAAVAAPITEEIMFRGVLYRHLRDITARWRILISIVFSVVVNSFIFAAIHPQGIFGIPLLMSLSIGFTLAREWRGSLIAPMVMHSINNGVVTIIAFTLMS